MLLGSVADEVVRGRSAPVLVCRPSVEQQNEVSQPGRTQPSSEGRAKTTNSFRKGSFKPATTTV
jgi:hypothetical protein